MRVEFNTVVDSSAEAVAVVDMDQVPRAGDGVALYDADKDTTRQWKVTRVLWQPATKTAIVIVARPAPGDWQT